MGEGVGPVDQPDLVRVDPIHISHERGFRRSSSDVFHRVGHHGAEGLGLREEQNPSKGVHDAEDEEPEEREVDGVAEEDQRGREDPSEPSSLRHEAHAVGPDDSREELGGKDEDRGKGGRGAELGDDGEDDAGGAVEARADGEGDAAEDVGARDGPSAPDPVQEERADEVRDHLHGRQGQVVDVDAPREVRHHEGDAVVGAADREPRHELHQEAPHQDRVPRDVHEPHALLLLLLLLLPAASLVVVPGAPERLLGRLGAVPGGNVAERGGGLFVLSRDELPARGLGDEQQHDRVEERGARGDEAEPAPRGLEIGEDREGHDASREEVLRGDAEESAPRGTDVLAAEDVSHEPHARDPHARQEARREVEPVGARQAAGHPRGAGQHECEEERPFAPELVREGPEDAGADQEAEEEPRVDRLLLPALGAGQVPFRDDGVARPGPEVAVRWESAELLPWRLGAVQELGALGEGGRLGDAAEPAVCYRVEAGEDHD